MRAFTIAALGFAIAASPAGAQPLPLEPPIDPDAPPAAPTLLPEPPPKDPAATQEAIVEEQLEASSSASVRGKPRPGAEGGRLDPVDTGDGTGRKVGRALLWIPRLPFEIAMLPIRGVVYLSERYHAVRTLTEMFTTDDHRVALYPTALFETGFGANLGIRGYVKDMLGRNEKLSARAAVGGEFLWTAELGFDSGSLLPEPVSVSLHAAYAQRDRERFFGYGNVGDEDSAAMPVDPLGDEGGIASRYRIQVARATARVRVKLPGRVTASASSAVEDKEYSGFSPNSSDADLADAYDVTALPGFAEGTRFVYNELELAWDTRRQADRWDAAAIRGTGGLALGYVGHQHALDGGSDFFRLGIDLQRYIRLTQRPRALQLRFWGEAVTGARDEVPFSELPRLGGDNLLRGYQMDRFRDRVAAVAQVGYTWAAATWLAPVLFVDAGRVFTGLDDLSLAKPRIGFGIALEAYNLRGLLVRAQIASSTDGGVFAFVALNPAYDAQSRVERY